MMNYADRIYIIARECEKQGVPLTVNPLHDGWQIRFPWCDGDVACHKYTYGTNAGKVESYQFPWDEDDVSVLTPEEAIERITDYWIEVRNEAISEIVQAYISSQRGEREE